MGKMIEVFDETFLVFNINTIANIEIRDFD